MLDAAEREEENCVIDVDELLMMDGEAVVKAWCRSFERQKGERGEVFADFMVDVWNSSLFLSLVYNITFSEHT